MKLQKCILLLSLFFFSINCKKNSSCSVDTINIVNKSSDTLYLINLLIDKQFNACVLSSEQRFIPNDTLEVFWDNLCWEDVVKYQEYKFLLIKDSVVGYFFTNCDYNQFNEVVFSIEVNENTIERYKSNNHIIYQ